MLRKPAVAGKFYPQDKDKLLKTVQGLCSLSESRHRAVGCILPHAGYMFSGLTAGKTISQVEVKDRILLLGPNHTGEGYPFSLYPKGAWSTPLGEVEIDEELSSLILQEVPHIKEDYSAHLYEHSLEVELPFLQYFNPHIKIAPVCLGGGDLDDWKEIGRGIAKVIKKNSIDVLVVASSDMTHYEDDNSARKKDSLAIEAILKLDEDLLVSTIKKYRISMCGYIPVSVMLTLCKSLGAEKAVLAHYSTSADALGDTSSVVGYAGIIVL